MTSLRMRRGPSGKEDVEDGLSLPLESVGSKDDLHDNTKRKIGHCWKCLFALAILVVAGLLAAKPFFKDWFQEINFILHHLSRTVDSLLLKQRQRPDNKIIYYLHLSKCGGTSLMDAASQSGLTVPIRNGLVQRDWRCCGEEDSMEAQAAYAKSTTFDFVANEGDMYDAMDLDHYDYVVTLRDSKSRYKSMWAQWQRDPVLFFLGRMNFTEFCDWFHEDNFIVRKVCGTRCMGKPKYTVTREDFYYTLKRLENFTDILFLEDFDASYAKFAKKHGWSAPAEKKRLSSTFGISTAKSDEDEWDSRMSALDDALYEFAKRLDHGEFPYQFSEEKSKNLQKYFSANEPQKGSTER